MAARNSIIGVAIGAMLTLSACGDEAPQLMNFPRTGTPDEFSILPPKPLQMPESLAALPEPTPGGSNITDPTPEADAVAALGGDPEVLAPSGTFGNDAALLGYTARHGTAAGIRETLAAEDLDYRKRNNGKLLERYFRKTVYFQAYAPQALDQYAELERWRRAGVQTPAAPPLLVDE